jgi:hypothetical protein
MRKKGDKYAWDKIIDQNQMMRSDFASVKNQMKVKVKGGLVAKAMQCIIPTALDFQLKALISSGIIQEMLPLRLKPQFKVSLLDDDETTLLNMPAFASLGVARVSGDIVQMDSGRTPVIVQAAFDVMQALGMPQEMAEAEIKGQFNNSVFGTWFRVQTSTGNTAGHAWTLILNTICEMLTTLANYNFSQVISGCYKGDYYTLIISVSKKLIAPSPYTWCEDKFIVYALKEKWTHGEEWTEFCHLFYNDSTVTADFVYRCLKIYGGKFYNYLMKTAMMRLVEFQVAMNDLLKSFCTVRGRFNAISAAQFHYDINDMHASIIIDAVYNFLNFDLTGVEALKVSAAFVYPFQKDAVGTLVMLPSVNDREREKIRLLIDKSRSNVHIVNAGSIDDGDIYTTYVAGWNSPLTASDRRWLAASGVNWVFAEQITDSSKYNTVDEKPINVNSYRVGKSNNIKGFIGIDSYQSFYGYVGDAFAKDIMH